MGMIWHGNALTWTEPIASAIAFIFGWDSDCGCCNRFFCRLVDSLTILLTFLVYVPQSKHAHLIAGPANVYFHRLDNVGKLTPIDFD